MKRSYIHARGWGRDFYPVAVGLDPGHAGQWKESFSHPSKGCEGPCGRSGTTPAHEASAAAILEPAAGDIPALRAVC